MFFWDKILGVKSVAVSGDLARKEPDSHPAVIRQGETDKHQTCEGRPKGFPSRQNLRNYKNKIIKLIKEAAMCELRGFVNVIQYEGGRVKINPVYIATIVPVRHDGKDIGSLVTINTGKEYYVTQTETEIMEQIRELYKK